MRLLYMTPDGYYAFHEVADASAVEYAIISHRWYPEGDILYQDVINQHDSDVRAKRGWRKIVNLCNLAKLESQALKYFWIDTCCIDKSSSAELTEAINSMFYWYKCAQICYVYLWDVRVLPGVTTLEAEFCRSEWFTRGWTLQELLAPQRLRFYDADWQSLGEIASRLDWIFRATRIDKDALTHRRPLSFYSVAQRMSWAAHRQTSRIEDRAYSLLGIFDVSLSMIYGEREKSFMRLQEEIIRTMVDESILTWRPDRVEDSYPGELFARSPADFARSGSIRSVEGRSRAFTVDARGLIANFDILRDDMGSIYALLNCTEFDDFIALNIASLMLDKVSFPQSLDGSTHPDIRLARRYSVSHNFHDSPINSMHPISNKTYAVVRYHTSLGGSRLKRIRAWDADRPYFSTHTGILIRRSLDTWPFHWGAPSLHLIRADEGSEHAILVNSVRPDHKVNLDSWSNNASIKTYMGSDGVSTIRLASDQLGSNHVDVAILVCHMHQENQDAPWRFNGRLSCNQDKGLSVSDHAEMVKANLARSWPDQNIMQAHGIKLEDGTILDVEVTVTGREEPIVTVRVFYKGVMKPEKRLFLAKRNRRISSTR